MSNDTLTQEQIEIASKMANAKRASASFHESFVPTTGNCDRFWIPRLDGLNCTDPEGKFKFPDRGAAVSGAIAMREHARKALERLCK